MLGKKKKSCKIYDFISLGNSNFVGGSCHQLGVCVDKAIFFTAWLAIYFQFCNGLTKSVWFFPNINNNTSTLDYTKDSGLYGSLVIVKNYFTYRNF